ncbi:MAG TPA: hypothetical protein VEP30_05030 [Chthoniobacterales bacterium]|nr:hypothetical protein [Chthoniobacterales bacterium]
MRLKRGFSIIFIFLAALSLRTVWGQLPIPTPANYPDPPYAVVTYNDGTSVVSPGAGGTFALVGLQANLPVQITVQYPISDSGQLINLEALDGGAVLPPSDATVPTMPNVPSVIPHQPPIPPLSLLTDNVAKLAFTFVPGSISGSYRIALRHGRHAMVLEFWVEDLVNPQNNPPAITAAEPANY